MDTLSKDAIYYALRLTPYPNEEAKVMYCRDKIPSFIEAVSGTNYIFGQEYEKNHHFHIVFEVPEVFTKDKIKDFTEILYTYFEVPKDKKGNPSFSLKPVKAIEKAFPYAVKDGDYDGSEGWSEVLTEAYENSFEKKYSMKSSLGSLSDKYIKDEINDEELWIGLGQSKAELGLPLSVRWINEMFLSIRCKKDPEILILLWEQNKST